IFSPRGALTTGSVAVPPHLQQARLPAALRRPMARSVKSERGSMESPDASALAVVGRIRRRMNLGLGIRALRAPLWIAVLLAAVYRLLFRTFAWQVAALVVTATLIVWVLRLRRHLYSLQAAAAVADRSGSAGGLLLTSLERPLGAWGEDLAPLLKNVTLPKLP